MNKRIKTVSIALLLLGLPVMAAQATNATIETIEIVQQNGAATGTVVDANGEPLSGASVIVKGTTKGTIVDNAGHFSLSGVKAGQTLRFTFVGYESQEVKWEGQALRITLKEDNNALNEVVVVGYGTQKKANLTGAVAAVDGSVLENRPVTSVGQGLQGVVPNLNITNGSGGAPGSSTSWNVRGTTSLNGGSPLVLVDGVQMDADLINPNDIESISVLKDGASASIYGARAAYGVILITTKKGRASDKPRISLSATGYYQTPSNPVHNVSGLEYHDMIDEAYHNDGGSGHFKGDIAYDYAKRYAEGTYDSPVFFDPNYDSYKYGYCGNTDWWKELYQGHWSQMYNANVSGGTDKTTYFASVGMNDQNGILRYGNDEYKKYNASMNITSQLTKWLQVTAKASNNFTSELHPTGGTTSMNSTAYSGISAYAGMLKRDLSPLMPVKHPDGNFAGQGGYTNPAALQAQGGNARYKVNDTWLTGAIKLTPVKGLVINADYTWNRYERSTKEHVQNFYDYTAVPGTENFYPWTNPSSVTLANTEQYYKALNAFAEYTLKVLDDHNFKFMAGYNQETQHYASHWSGRTNLIDNTNPSMNLATGTMKMNSSETHWAVNGIFARINYDYQGKYLLELNGRYDGSSKFASDGRYAFFPSASAGWRISEEKFMAGTRGWLDNLKLRASWSSLGNQAVSSNFPYLATYGVNTAYGYLLNNQLPVAVTVPGLVSGGLTWETVNQVNVGVDATFLGNRLDFGFDWYRRDTKDMLTSGAALPATLGASVPQENNANLKTLGWELSLGWQDKTAGGFSYHAKFVLSDYQSTITKFDNPQNLRSTYYVGRKIGEIWGLTADRLLQKTDDLAAYTNSVKDYFGFTNWQAGDVMYKDINGDGVVNDGENTTDNPGDFSIIGNNTPRFAYGITAGFEYKGFDFEMFWQGIGKRDYWLGHGNGNGFWAFPDEWETPTKANLDYWTESNTDAYYPRLHLYNEWINAQTSTLYLQKASYIRLKNVQLGYTIPQDITRKIKLERCRFFIQGENLLTFSPISDTVDPENLGNLTYPINKKVSLGVNLTF